MKVLLINSSSTPPKMIPGEHPKPEPAPHELLVKIEATALNRADLLQKAGKYPVPKGASPILGLEMAGIVEAAGEGVERYEPGDAVFGLLSGGGYAEYCTIHEQMAMPVPESLSFEEAAAIPEVFLTAWQALLWEGEIFEGETVLIHAGASGVGTAAIQLAKEFGARVITTSSKKKTELCRELGADVAIDYKNRNFADVIETETGKNAVNLVIDFIGAPYWEDNIRILAMDGRVVYLSMLGGASVEKMSLVPVLRKRLTFRGSTLRNRSDDYKTELTEEFSDAAFELIESGKIVPVIDSVYDWQDVEKAHERMKTSQNAGKIVLTGM
ncbi:MAG: NAD(P)H-quinone oxidoreductase [Balneolaceae bacterium]